DRDRFGRGVVSRQGRPHVQGELPAFLSAPGGVQPAPGPGVLLLVLAPGDPVRVAVLGATSAIAQAAARLWAERGAELVLVGRDPEKLAAVADDLRTRGGQVETVVQDLNEDQAPLVERLGATDVTLIAQGIFGDPQRRDVDPEYAEVVL